MVEVFYCAGRPGGDPRNEIFTGTGVPVRDSDSRYGYADLRYQSGVPPTAVLRYC